MPTPDRPVEPIRATGKAPWSLARFAQAAIGVAAVAEVFRGTTFRAHRLNPDATPAGRSGLAAMVSVYAVTLAAALFLVWFHRCRRNARLISPGAALGSDAWAVVAWLIPVVNLWVPRGLLLATQRASDAGTARKGRDDVLVNAWWVAWVAHMVTGTVGRSGTSLPLLLAAQTLNIAAALLAALLIQRITAAQSSALGVTPSALQGT